MSALAHFETDSWFCPSDMINSERGARRSLSASRSCFLLASLPLTPFHSRVLMSPPLRPFTTPFATRPCKIIKCRGRGFATSLSQHELLRLSESTLPTRSAGSSASWYSAEIAYTLPSLLLFSRPLPAHSLAIGPSGVLDVFPLVSQSIMDSPRAAAATLQNNQVVRLWA